MDIMPYNHAMMAMLQDEDIAQAYTSVYEAVLSSGSMVRIKLVTGKEELFTLRMSSKHCGVFDSRNALADCCTLASYVTIGRIESHP